MPARDSHPLVRAFERAARMPAGAGTRAFTQAVCFRAPYFGSIRPHLRVLERGRAEATFPKRRAVTNHLGTVHAIAMCNACELVGGLVTEVTVPRGLRWIPKGMEVEYLRKATTDLRAVAELDVVFDEEESVELPVPARVLDTDGEIVMQAEIRMWVTPKPR